VTGVSTWKLDKQKSKSVQDQALVTARSAGCNEGTAMCHSYGDNGKCVDSGASRRVCSACLLKFSSKQASVASDAGMREFEPPNDPKDPWGRVKCHPSCKTCLPSNGRPTACTSCPGTGGKALWTKAGGYHHSPCEGGPCHHTIIDARYNAGTCDVQPCQFCKPRACCGPHHKHFMIDADKMAGVCVRHTDDCTPLCVQSRLRTGKRAICSKGCNQLTRKDYGDVITINVCQADKQVFCDASQPKARALTRIPAESALFSLDAPATEMEKCSSLKKVSCKLSCTGITEVQAGQLHRVGGTCMLSIVESPSCFGATGGMLNQTALCDEAKARCPVDLVPIAVFQALGTISTKCRTKCKLDGCKSTALAF